MAEPTLFERIIRGEIPSRKVYEDDLVYAFHDVRPVAPVHVLVVPKKPIPDLNAAGAADAPYLSAMWLAAAHIARDLGLHETGWRCVVNNGADAGQTVFHLHLHVLGGRTLGWPPG